MIFESHLLKIIKSDKQVLLSPQAVLQAKQNPEGAAPGTDGQKQTNEWQAEQHSRKQPAGYLRGRPSSLAERWISKAHDQCKEGKKRDR